MKSFKDSPIQFKITCVIMFTTVVSLLIAGITLLLFDIRQAEEKLARELSSIAQIIAANSTAALEFDDPKAAERILNGLQKDKRIAAAGLYRENGDIFAAYTRENDLSAAIPAVPGQRGTSREGSYLKLVSPVSIGGRTVGTLYIQADVSQLAESLKEYAIILALAILFSSIGAYFISFHLRNLISRPILRLAETALAVAQRNDYSLRVTKEGNDEIGLLIDRFNEMLAQITTQNAALKENEDQLRLITDSVPVLISYVDREGRFRFNNALYQEWFQLSRADIFGKSLAEVAGPIAYESVRPHIEAALAGNPQTFETTIDLPNGMRRFVVSSYVPDFSDQGVVRGFFALVNDITDRKKSENELKTLNELLEQRVLERTQQLQQSQEQLRHSERLASIGTLAAGIAHEINNPINSILLASQYALRYSGVTDDKLRETFTSIADESKRCGKIIKNVLQFAKAEKTKKWPHDVNQVVKRAAELAKNYIRSNGLEVEMKLEEAVPNAMLNPTEIEQVLVNLIENASEASGGKVKVRLSTSRLSSGVRIEVSDNGPGIPEESVKHIFDPFYSTRRERGGTGLGLSIAHGIIADHGGTMTVQSVVGRGTQFYIDLIGGEERDHHGENPGR